MGHPRVVKSDDAKSTIRKEGKVRFAREPSAAEAVQFLMRLRQG